MRKGGSKQKGAAFEREVSEALSLWVSDGERDDLFWRSAMSGGRATVKFKTGKKNQTQGGDISAVHPAGHTFLGQFAVECKFYKELNIETSLLRGYGTLIGFWGEAVRMAQRQRKTPMLIAKQNNFPPLVLMDKEGVNFLGCMFLVRVKFNCLDGKRPVYVVRFDEMLKGLIPP